MAKSYFNKKIVLKTWTRFMVESCRHWYMNCTSKIHCLKMDSASPSMGYVR